MEARRGIAEGMTVYTQDGEKLGKVVAVDDAGLFVEKGFFFPKEYGFRFDDVADVRDDGVYLRLAKEAVSSALVEDDQGVERSLPSAIDDDAGQLGTAANPPEGSTANTGLQWGMEPLGTAGGGTSGRRSDSIQEGADASRIDELERTGIASGRVPVDESGRGVAPSRLESDVRSGLAPGRTADEGRDLGDTDRPGSERTAGADRDVTIPVAEEQLEARKTEREAGELKVHKRVMTEQKTVSVPVRRETADVERVAVSDRPVSGDEGLFRDEGDVRRSDRRDPDDHHVP